MNPYYEQSGVTIYHGDCRDVMDELPSESVDIVWTDPPERKDLEQIQAFRHAS